MSKLQGIDEVTVELGRGSEIALGLALAIMMLSVALTLAPSNFNFLKKQPKPFIVGALLQLLGLPLLTLALCFAIKPSPSVALGMILISCCPGGNVSNVLVMLSRGNTALSVSLTAFSSFTAAFITPLAILFWCGLYPPTSKLLNSIDFNTWSFLIQTSVILVLPIVLGMLIKIYFGSFAKRIQKPLTILSTVLLLAIITLGLMKHWSTFLVLGVGVISLVVLHNGLAFLMGNLIAKFCRLDEHNQRAITFEVGIQNAGLGIVILLTQMSSLGGAAVVAGLWGVWHIMAGLLLAVTFVLTDKFKSK